MKPSRAAGFARAVLAGFAVVCGGVLLLAIVRRPDSGLYYVGPVAGLAFAAFTLSRAEDMQVNVALALVAVGVALYAAEATMVLARLAHYDTRFDWEKRRIAAARAAGVAYDLRTQLQVVNDLRGQGTEAVARVHPSAFLPSDGLGDGENRVFPLGGIARAVTVTCNELGEWAIVDTDEHGFRNPLGEWERDRFDVVLIGDSYAFSACVPQGEGLASSLRAGGRTVLNLGFGGNGPLLALAALSEYGAAYRPGAVVWLWYEGNDFLDLEAESRSGMLLRYLDAGHRQGLSDERQRLDSLMLDYHERRRAEAEASARTRWRCVPILCGVRNLLVRSRTSMAAGEADEAELAEGTETAPARDHPVDMLEQILGQARDRVRGWGGELYFVYLPSWARYAVPMDRDLLNGRPLVLGAVAEAGVPLIDFAEILGRHPDPLALFPYRERGHFTSEGYAYLADQIARRLPAPSD